MLDAVTAGLLPQPGDIKWVAYNVVAGSEPAGWLLCDGRTNLSTTTYAALFSAIGYIHGGSGAQFGIPDMRGRSPIGIGTGTYLGTQTARSVGDKGGAEYVTLSTNQIPSHNHSVSVNSSGTGISIVGVGDHTHSSPVQSGIYGEFVVVGQTGDNGTTYSTQRWGTDASSNSIQRAVSGTTSAGGHSHSVSDPSHGHSVNQSSVGGGLAHDNMHPYIALTPLIKT
jgi:microcystin-dependent protein